MAEPGVSLLLDGRALGGAGAYRGLGTYARELVAGLAGRADVDLTVLAPPGAPLAPGVTRVGLSQLLPDRWATAEHHARLALFLERGRRAAAGGGDVVFHAPAQDPPARVGLPWVQTVADVLPLVRPEPAYATERKRWRRWAGRVGAAGAVVTFSRYGAEQVGELLGVDEGRIHVIPLAAGAQYRPAGGDGPVGEDRAPFVLSVGEYAPHKGYAELARLAAGLERAGVPHRVVVAGRTTGQWRRERERELGVAGASARDRIDLAGWVPDLAPLYRRAAVVVSTSRHEGFGLPLVEAMACGAPVVAFANSAVGEVVGAGGALVADGDVEAMAEVILKLLADDRSTAAARDSALRRSAEFNWAATVSAHVHLYRSVLESHGS